jgi:antitoxin component of MazEF toxin-antitoxin module
MIRKLVKHGDEFAIVIDASLLQQMQIDESTSLSLSIDGRELRVAPVEGLSPERFEQIHQSINQRYAKTFKRLAEES